MESFWGGQPLRPKTIGPKSDREDPIAKVIDLAAYRTSQST